MRSTPASFALAFVSLAACSTPAPETPDAAAPDDAAIDAASDDAGRPDTGPRQPDAYVRDASFADAGMTRADYGNAGPYVVGNVHTTMVDRTGDRMLPVEIWYPADESARAAATTGQPLLAFEQGGAHEAALTALLASAPACVRTTVHSALAAPASSAEATWPAVVFSHCHGCMRYDVAEVAERLASHGIVVAAPDHVDDTIWEAGSLPAIGPEFLAVRASDVSSVLDRLLDPTAAELPADLRGHIDGTRVAVMGHSYGALTTGAAVSTDDRFAAALAIAAPISIFGLRPADVHVPYLYLLASEDNSIGAAGNRVIRNDYAAAGAPAWLVEVADAGHWSFSDIAGLTDAFDAGCGMGMRQDAPHAAFTYLDNAEARELASDVAAAFFAITLLEDPAAANELSALTAPATVSLHD
ncbi:MAG: dienelactone hydrolase family protein [Sandaracinus sp.]